DQAGNISWRHLRKYFLTLMTRDDRGTNTPMRSALSRMLPHPDPKHSRTEFIPSCSAEQKRRNKFRPTQKGKRPTVRICSLPLPPLERRFALFEECLDRFAMVFRPPGECLAGGFAVQQRAEVGG